jgi:hypothetical protein
MFFYLLDDSWVLLAKINAKCSPLDSGSGGAGLAEAPLCIGMVDPVGWKLRKNIVTLVQKVANTLAQWEKVREALISPSIWLE